MCEFSTLNENIFALQFIQSGKMSEKEVRKVCNSVSLATTQWKMAVAQGRCESL